LVRVVVDLVRAVDLAVKVDSAIATMVCK
jgi:hypothetical protein